MFFVFVFTYILINICENVSKCFQTYTEKGVEKRGNIELFDHEY